MPTYADIPEIVIEYVRSVFARANEKVSRTLADHPSMHEEMLDQTLITELTVAPAAVFAEEQAAVIIESHWLGGRRMYGRWEIADIALLILLRRAGNLEQRKVVLLQTKRLYSREISVSQVDQSDYVIGIGRLGDRTDRAIPLGSRRAFSFSDACVYGAMHSGAEQVGRIDEYVRKNQIPVFYSFYNPVQLPYNALYPAPSGQGAGPPNLLGCRVQPSSEVHSRLQVLPAGQAPSLAALRSTSPMGSDDPFSTSGWRLEVFVADEVLRCRQGTLFDGTDDANLEALFYRRSAPITAAITITIDIGGRD